MIEQLTGLPGRIIGFKMSGTLHDADYKQFVPAIDEAAKTNKVRLLAEFQDFHGWDLKALWDDIKFATSHCTKFDRIALVGEKRWEEWMAKICTPFTLAKIRYFDHSQMQAAKDWLQEGTKGS